MRSIPPPARRDHPPAHLPRPSGRRRRPGRGRGPLPRRQVRRMRPRGRRGDRRGRGLDRAVADPQDLRRDAAGPLRRRGAIAPARPPPVPREHPAPPARADVYRYNGRAEDVPRLMEDLERIVMGSPQRYATPEGRVALGRFFLHPRRRFPRRCSTSSTTSRSTSSPAWSRPTSPPPSWPWPSRTSPSPPRRSARRPRPPPRTRGSTTCWPAPFSGGPHRLRQGAGRGPEDQPAPRRQPPARGRPPDRLREVRRGGEGFEAGRSTVNPHEPRAFAYQAVLAHLRNDPERRGRRPEIRPWRAWAENPEVDHLIGRKLSQKYRFAEGSAYQRKALELDPDYLPGQAPALPGPAPPRRGGRGLEARRRDLRQRRLQRGRLQPDHAARPPRRIPDARGTTASSSGWTRRGRPLRPPRPRPARPGEEDALRALRRPAAGPVIVEIFPQQQGVRRADLRPARRRRPARRLLRPGDHGQQPGQPGSPPRRTGRPCSGTSSAMSSP